MGSLHCSWLIRCWKSALGLWEGNLLPPGPWEGERHLCGEQLLIPSEALTRGQAQVSCLPWDKAADLWGQREALRVFGLKSVSLYSLTVTKAGVRISTWYTHV